ncbi:hypothetical protein BDB00DRAFT_402711 [Zychaea mexicana]|uniref:uncharacterized protein n=1 Tax=Zychaea mexicana TaxID=64656 RepID=UPI0022FEA700|nr:uncharacterized protein BDB00DRAFT_402711 [Zychaea mexicana]KAI9498774.1 hypothetical protein BDB00DRAFT_402711 [Zychaea mexicana]
MSNISPAVDHHQTTIDSLTQELKVLLDTFCSDAQQRFCLEQRVASQQQLQRIRQTIQHIRNSSEFWTSTPNSDSIRQSLMRTCVEMLDCYQAVCLHRRIRALPEGRAQQLTLDWQQLSQSFEMKAKEQANLAALFDNLKNLRKAWKKPRQIERLLTSLLVTYELREGAYVVVIDSHNYHQLGLKRKAVGTRQLVFECSRMSRQDQMDEVAGICDRFASVFAQNAQHNLAQIEAQVQLAQLTLLAKRLRKLQDQIFYFSSTSQQTAGMVDDDNDDEDDVSSIDGDIGRSQIDPLPAPTSAAQAAAPAAPAPPPFVPFRSVAPSLWYIQDETGIQGMPTPSFIPSPWQWPDLLQVHRPYYPILFGIIKRRRVPRQSRVPFFVRLKGVFSARARYLATTAPTTPATMGPPPTPHRHSQQHHRHSNTTSATEDDNDMTTAAAQGHQYHRHQHHHHHQDATGSGGSGEDDSAAAFASVSISNLCGHLCRTGRQFYEDVASNAQLKHSQDGHILQEIGRDLVETYAAIQLEASRALMHRILTILQDLTVLDHSQHDDWEAVAAAAVAAAATTTRDSSTRAQQQQQSSSFIPAPAADEDDDSAEGHHHLQNDRRSSRIESHISLPSA